MAQRHGSFIDRVKLFVKAGDGGNGCLSFRREKFIEFGGPNGGDGGDGGDVFFMADRNITTLLELSYHPHIKGNDGTNGMGSLKAGKDGHPITVMVPCGTIVRRDGAVIADMTVQGQKLLIAKGGKGGRGNASFKTRFNTAPKLAENGGKGDEIVLELELKVLADVGFVGLPNAGKSTLLAQLSSARPKIADYPFTTLDPNLGMVSHKGKSFAAADIPGLIEGASEGRGLGHDFLRHVERTRVLVHLVDPSGFADYDAVKSVRVIADELKKFNPKLAKRERIIVVNKADLPGADAVYAKIKKTFKKNKVFLLSAATGKGVAALLDEIVRLLNKMPYEEEAKPASGKKVVVRHSMAPAYSIKRGVDDVLEVEGKEILRMLELTNFSQPEALARLLHMFKRIGLEKALIKHGVAEGESVRLCGREFEWSQAAFDPRPQKMVSRRRR